MSAGAERVTTGDLSTEEDVVLGPMLQKRRSGYWVPKEKYDAMAAALEALEPVRRLLAAMEHQDGPREVSVCRDSERSFSARAWGSGDVFAEADTPEAALRALADAIKERP